MLLSTAFFPPVEYFAKIAEGFTLSPDEVKPSLVWIEGCEIYQKQSYRNRFKFYAENGVQMISVPIIHDGGTHSIPIRDIRIDWDANWLIRCERAIISAYEGSAYFDYYKDELFAILDSKPEKLFDLNMQLLEFFLRKTGIAAEVRITEEFTSFGSDKYGEDLRDVIHPKKQNDILERLSLKKPYFQVFAQKHGFISNLSIMDLLFNEGPDSIIYLKNAIRK